MKFPDEKCKSGRFIVYSDNRNTGLRRNKNHRKILDLISQQEKDFIIHVGDMVFWDLGWFSFFWDLRHANIDKTIFTVRGNHDLPLSYRLFLFFARKRLNLQNKKTYYSIEYGNALLIILDDNAGVIDKKQYKWFVELLKASSKFTWKFVFAHKPIYSGANHGVRERLIEQLCPLFKKYHVNLFIGSHFHSYERLEVNGTTHIITAGGGAPLTDLHTKIPQLIKHIKKFNFLAVKVEKGKKVVELTAYDINNEIIDKKIIKS